MDNQKATRVIKLYFEIDDGKAALNMEDILNTNDELTKKMNKLEGTNSAQNLVIQENQIRMKELSEAIRLSESNKSLEAMALSGYKALHGETMVKMTELQEEVKVLKLDLMAERELRRIHQGKLRQFDPKNDNYNPDAVVSSTTVRSSTSLGGAGPSMTANDLSVEAKVVSGESEPAVPRSSPEIPIKISKSTAAMLNRAYIAPKTVQKQQIVCQQRIRPMNPEQKQQNAKRPSSEPSTSAAAYSFPTQLSTPYTRFSTSKPASLGGSPVVRILQPSQSPPISQSQGQSSRNNVFLFASGSTSSQAIINSQSSATPRQGTFVSSGANGVHSQASINNQRIVFRQTNAAPVQNNSTILNSTTPNSQRLVFGPSSAASSQNTSIISPKASDR